ncbi:MAG: hypothetical protein WBP38_01535 [Hyphomicrobium sp.]|jgi:hypothetical protein
MRMKRMPLAPAVFAGLALLLSPAFADDNHDHAGTHAHAGKHGGTVVETPHHHLEIVAKDGVLEVYVNGLDMAPESVADAKAIAAVMADGRKSDITLTADPANFLKGSGTFTAAKGTIIVVTLTMPGQKPEQARIKVD